MLRSIEYPLSCGHAVTLDADMLHLIEGYQWRSYRYRHTRYALCDQFVNGKTKRIYMHRLLLGVSNKSLPYVDHIDGNGLNNCLSNLRLASPGQNAQNTKVRSGQMTKPYRGVFASHGGYIARLGRKHYAGTFQSEMAAAFAYDDLARSAYGPNAKVNFDLDRLKTWPMNRFLSTL